MTVVSKNERAEALFGRRPEGGIAFDQPCELGYWCPVCQVAPVVDGEFDERLHWSEYNGFIWCSVCNLDLPSAMCVPLHGEKWADRDWVNVGPEDAVKVFLDTVAMAVERATAPDSPEHQP